MAKIEFNHPASENFPGFTETIEVRVWGLGGTEQQFFFIGSGVNSQASGNYWLEIIYSVEGAQVFYARNFLQYFPNITEAGETQEDRFNKFLEEGTGTFGFGDMLPETSLLLTLEKFSYPDDNEVEQEFLDCSLKISTDIGSVFGRTGPGARSLDVELKSLKLADGVRFMRELLHEIEDVRQGKHPDPASIPAGSSNWLFLDQLNQQAYNKISEDYQEVYFDNPLLAEALDSWLSRLPMGGQVMDVGCGHGDPVIRRLLEHGFRVTGSDLSPEMLRRAREKFPQANFLQTAMTRITDHAVFDGICSFNSLLYLDPIDLLNSVYRLHCALKPGGLLFLYAFDSGPSWRGEPFGHRVGQWMWSWHYGMEEVASLLEEHGYFRVLATQKVQVDEAEAERIAQELDKQKQEEAEYYHQQENNPFPIPLPFFKEPIERSPYAYIVIAQRCEK